MFDTLGQQISNAIWNTMLQWFYETILFGISLLTEGILNLSTVLTAVKIVRHQMPDVIEVDYYEEGKD